MAVSRTRAGNAEGGGAEATRPATTPRPDSDKRSRRWTRRSGVSNALVGVWQGVAIDLPKFHLGPPYPTLLCPARGPLLKRPYGRFRDGLPKGWAGCIAAVFYPFRLPSRTPMAGWKLCLELFMSLQICRQFRIGNCQASSRPTGRARCGRAYGLEQWCCY
jgi:hypothetical protein